MLDHEKAGDITAEEHDELELYLLQEDMMEIAKARTPATFPFMSRNIPEYRSTLNYVEINSFQTLSSIMRIETAPSRAQSRVLPQGFHQRP